jgi:Ca-activated chloride channel family protein
MSSRSLTRTAAALAAAALLSWPLPGPAHGDGASLSILEPEEGSFVSGRLTLRARVEPEGLPVLRLTFAADGEPVCVRERPPFECPWDAGPAVVSHELRVVATLGDGRRLVSGVRTQASAVAHPVEVNVVQVAATVTDKGGRVVRGLEKGSFRVLEDGVPQPLTHFLGEGTAQELVVAVDVSGSMGEAMPACRLAVKGFLSSLTREDRVTLLAFNDSVFTLAKREADAAARLRAVDRLAPWGGTALYDTLLRALDLLDRQHGRRALVLFSDGEDQSSHATVEDVERRVEVSDTPIHIVAQGKGTREPHLKRVLDRLADVSGGRAFYTDGVDELPAVFAEITEVLRSQYLLAYDPTNPERDGSWRTIRVEVAGKAHRVRARQGYRATTRRR